MDEISRASVTVMTCWVMFSYIIGFVGFAREPDEVDDVALDVVSHPKIAHIHAFGFAWFHGISEKTMADFIVSD